MFAHPVFYALLATLFTWGVTAVGAAGVLVYKKANQNVLDGMLGFTAGVMIAASFWSLLAPSIALARSFGAIPWVPPLVGFLTGGAFLFAVDKLLPHLHLYAPQKETEGVKTGWHKTFLLFLAITLHNIPEGLAIGVAFGAASLAIPGVTLVNAIALAVGIGIQNFPEGFAVSMPFRREGVSRFKSFLYGQASALVEPVAAGAMIYVSVEEIIPESQTRGTDSATIGAMIGFAIMMTLDVAFSP
ncbi:MAG: Zinc/iron permease [uncultured bacterium]|uniref:Dihydroorotate dehydrogenase n=1 Tax=Candidatus Gottesmanbacteria bacterium RIFCSPLOWO2_01_FULL_43_11b TaxID=1798392 RepID=A0A1F6AIB0_9BACT|nr:MAG: Zinc/iron permease [uncultured bacterium]OGG24143.1 MAG: dihydroorotate dehydrogenase [Candidatus Gottesmanbacteria bacterium RIFCSPLOWO2_01_FULL_43_11b]